MRASGTDLATLQQHGLRATRLRAGRSEWVLLDPDGAPLHIREHGCLAPSQALAVAEGLARIERGDYVVEA